MSSAAAESPLGRALDGAGFGGMPVEIWVAIANGWSVDGPRISVADAETFARAHPEVVRSYKSPDGTRYQRLRAETTTVGETIAMSEERNPAPSSPEREDTI